MAINIRPLKPTPNDQMMDRIRNSLSTDYQRRIPEATKVGVRAASQAMLNYTPTLNEFADALVNQIGQILVRNTSWSNPLSIFKRGLLEAGGDTIEEIQLGLVKARTYNPDREYLEKDIFGTHRVDMESNFHKVNRRDYYPITVSRELLRGAFTTAHGLESFVNKILEAPLTSDQWDEFLLMTSLFQQYESNGGYYHVHVPDVRSISAGGQEAKEVLRKVRAMAQNLTFLSTKYNAAHMPTFARAEELVLICTPEFAATIDVEALAGAFNMEKAAMPGRQIVVPAEHWGIDGAQAILTTEEHFIIGDYILENSSADNPVGLHQNHFLHHHQIISQSRFTPAVIFWTGADDEVINVIEPVTGISAITVTTRDGNNVATVNPGEIYVVSAKATDKNSEPLAEAETAVRFTVSGTNDPRTRVTQFGTIHVGLMETANFKIHAHTVWVDPRDPAHTEVYSGEKAITVTGPTAPEWPVDHKHESMIPDADPAG